MPAFHVFPRSQTPSDSASPSISNPIYIAGIIVAAVIFLGFLVWMGLRAYRKRLASKRESQMGAAFLSVKGLVREDEVSDEKAGSLQRTMTQSNGFSRNMIDSTVVLPEKARLPGAVSRAEVIEQHRQSGAFPAPFAPKPFSFALATNSERNSALLDPEGSSQPRNSWMSFGSSTQNRFSVASTTSSFDVTTTSGTMRKVRQLFEPVLPDELLLTRLGEHLTVVQSFDDGWCVVGREHASLVHTAKSLFKTSPDPESDVELGVVPAWCFLKPVKGLRAERPVRSSSLGITVNMEAPGFSSRNDLVSWSNF
ncbi:hypothetical protein BDZ97DRAFT_1905168 [Flammula alnicola]|nr:hypothetical protein BDZ97DRAFT_1905168 [Flammula alnicola]